MTLNLRKQCLETYSHFPLFPFLLDSGFTKLSEFRGSLAWGQSHQDRLSCCHSVYLISKLPIYFSGSVWNMRMITTVISQSWPLLCVSVCFPIRPDRHWGVSAQCRSGLGTRPALVSDVGVWENFKERGGNHHKVKKPLFKKFFCSPPLSLKFVHIARIRGRFVICGRFVQKIASWYLKIFTE